MLKWDKKQLNMNNELSAQKTFEGTKELLPKWKQPAKFEKALKSLKSFKFWKKSFSLIKKNNFVKEGSKFRDKSSK